MVSSTLCPAVRILGSENVYGRAEGIAGPSFNHIPYEKLVIFWLILICVQGNGIMQNLAFLVFLAVGLCSVARI